MPLISLITIVKNNARGLRSTGRSIAIQQNAPAFEWLVIDGGSSDNTPEVRAEFTELNPVFISEPDKGLYDAMNKGLERSTGEYIWFLNGGDCLSDAFTLKDIARAMQVHFKPDFFYADAREAGHMKPAKPYHTLKRGMITHHQAMLYRRIAVGDTRFDTAYNIAADYAFTLDVAGRTQRIYHYPRVICDFQPGGVSQQDVVTGRRENFAIRDKTLQMHPVMNRFYFQLDRFTYWLRQNYPKLFWLLR